MRQDIFVFRYWGWWVLVALLRLAHLFVGGVLIMTGDVRGDSLWLLPESRLPELFAGFTGGLVFLDTLLVGYGVSVAFNLWQRNKARGTTADAEAAAWPPPPKTPQTGPEPPAV